MSAIPLSQNTAPVHEHRCLYTHDLRRKAKRWQDGFLRFHTFNNRVMVYDVSRNFIGDTHHQDGGSDGFADGDDLTLERTGVLIQVGERLETQQTDISRIVSKRVPKPLDNNGDEINPGGVGYQGSSHLQPRSINVLPKTPARWAGWTGRAQIPQKSPFEEQHASKVVEESLEVGRDSKRRRRDDEHIPLWEVLKTSKPSRQKAPSDESLRIPLWPRVVEARTNEQLSRCMIPTKKGHSQNQRTLKVKEVIDITSSTDDTPETITNTYVRQGRSGVYNSSSPSKNFHENDGFLRTRQQAPCAARIRHVTLMQPPPTLSTANTGEVDQSPTPARKILDEASAPRNHRQLKSPHQDYDKPTVAIASLDPPVPAQQPKQRIVSSKSIQPIRYNYDIRTTPKVPQSHLPQGQHPSSSLQSSPPVSTTNHLPPVNEPSGKDVQTEKEWSNHVSTKSCPDSPIRPLRLSSALPCKMLVSQNLAENTTKTLRGQRQTLPVPQPKPNNRPSHIETTNFTTPARKKGTFARKASRNIDVDDIDSTPVFETMKTPSSVFCDDTISMTDVKPRRTFTKAKESIISMSHLPLPTEPSVQQPELRQRYKYTPPDYSHVDAQLLGKPTHGSTTLTSKFMPRLTTRKHADPPQIPCQGNSPLPTNGLLSQAPPLPTLQVAGVSKQQAPPVLIKPQLSNPPNTTSITSNVTNQPINQPINQRLAQPYRPLRRHASDTTHLFLAKPEITSFPQHIQPQQPQRQPQARPQPQPQPQSVPQPHQPRQQQAQQKRTSTLLKRAETISGTNLLTTFNPPSRTSPSNLHKQNPPRRMEASTTKPADANAKDAKDANDGRGGEGADKGGPWSSEAWDLFGWVPEGMVLVV